MYLLLKRAMRVDAFSTSSLETRFQATPIFLKDCAEYNTATACTCLKRKRGVLHVFRRQHSVDQRVREGTHSAGNLVGHHGHAAYKTNPPAFASYFVTPVNSSYATSLPTATGNRRTGDKRTGES